jgi:DNA-binding MarR family transcriptional regulator
MTAEGRTGPWDDLLRFQRLTTLTMDRSLKDRFDHGLDDYDVLHQLVMADRPLTMGELAARLLVANSSCNRIVGRLVDVGLVERTPGPHDRRQVLAAPTTEGKRLHRRMAAVHTRDIERLLLDRLSDDERRTIGSVFNRLVADDAEASRP